jgi:hypothetical protein
VQKGQHGYRHGAVFGAGLLDNGTQRIAPYARLNGVGTRGQIGLGQARGTRHGIACPSQSDPAPFNRRGDSLHRYPLRAPLIHP